MTGTKRTGNRVSVLFTLAVLFLLTATTIPGVKGVSAVGLGAADPFAILSKAGIPDTPTSHITGDVGTSPDGGITIALNCSDVTETIYTVDPPDPVCRIQNAGLLGSAVTDMQSAYSTAQALPSPDYTDVGGGEIGGLTLAPGLYRFNSAVSIANDVVLDGRGDGTAVWIFQVPGTSALTVAANKNVILRGGARADNVFWIVGGDTSLGAGSGFNGTILDGAAITLDAGATVTGRALAQTTVTLNADTITVPAIMAAPVADFTFTNATGTAPLYVAFTDTSTPGGQITTWAWDFGDGANSTVQSPAHTYDTTGGYTVNLTVTDGTGAISSKTGTVTVNQSPSADFTFTNETGTAPLYVVFTDTSTPLGNIAHWAWDFGDGTNDTARSPAHTYSLPGRYTINLTVTDTSGIVATKIVAGAVNVTHAGPVADFTFTPASGPARLAVTFTDNSTTTDPIVSWAWDFGDGSNVNATLRNPVHTYAAAGNYTVNLTVTDSTSASDTKTVTNAVNVDPPSFAINLVNVPVSLALIPGETTTNTDAQFMVNSTTNWQVTARDDDTATMGYMTNYSVSGSQYSVPATRLAHPFMVMDGTSTYAALPSGGDTPAILKSGAPEASGTAYPLGIRQQVTMADVVLPGTNVYRIVITLTAGSV